MAAVWACEALGRKPLRSLTRSMPIAKTGSLNAAFPRVTAAICLRSYLLRGAEPNPPSGGAQTPDKWQCVQWLSGVLAASPQKKNVREESISCVKGNQGESVGVFAGVNNGQMARDGLQVQSLFFKRQKSNALSWLARRFMKIVCYFFFSFHYLNVCKYVESNSLLVCCPPTPSF